MPASTPLLVSSLVSADDTAPDAWVVFLHGILGSGANWRTFARQLVARRPRWGTVLVDLRMHGTSQGFPPPHTVEQAARDLVELRAPGPLRAVVGHSFGGKVALAYTQMRAELGDPLNRVWVVDSTPSARLDARGSESTLAILDALEANRGPFETRQAFADGLRAYHLTDDIIQWLAMNVRRDGDLFRLRMDLSAVRALLDDYFARDLWPVIEAPRDATRLELIVGGRSQVLDEADRVRAARAAAAHAEQVSLVVLPNAGHWVHVDDPAGLLDAIAAGLA